MSPKRGRFQFSTCWRDNRWVEENKKYRVYARKKKYYKKMLVMIKETTDEREDYEEEGKKEKRREVREIGLK